MCKWWWWGGGGVPLMGTFSGGWAIFGGGFFRVFSPEGKKFLPAL